MACLFLDLKGWKEEVFDKATGVVERFLQGNSGLFDPRWSDWAVSWLTGTHTPEPANLSEWRKYVCEICGGKVLNGEHAWQAHYKSRSHKRRVSGAHKRKRNEEQMLLRKQAKRETPTEAIDLK